MRMTTTTLAAGLLLAIGAPASAQMVDAADPNSVLEAVRAFGHKARIETDEEGLPVIRARVEDINYGVYFYGCDGTVNCRQLQLAASFDLDPGLSAQFVNDWNEQWAIGRLSVNADGDPLFTYYLVTEGGLSPQTFTATMQLWTDALFGVITDIGY